MDAYQLVGFLGGLLFPVATGFQTFKVFWTRSAKDISYGWQFVYGLGHALYLVYSIHFNLWVIYASQAVELVFLIAMTIGKVYFDNFYQPKKKQDESIT